MLLNIVHPLLKIADVTNIVHPVLKITKLMCYKITIDAILFKHYLLIVSLQVSFEIVLVI